MSQKAEEQEQDLVTLVRERYDAGAKAMHSVLSDWEEARLFYRGDQWLKPMGTKWVPSKAEPYRVRLTVNKFIPVIESMISTYLKTRPIIIANAGTDEDIDVKSAKISEILLRFYFEELEFDNLNFDTVLWLGVAGSCFQRVQWDPTKGRKAPVMADPSPGDDPQDVAEGAEDELREEPAAPSLASVGQPVVDVLAPFAVTPEPGAEKFSDAHWCIVTEIVHKNDVRARWGVKVKDTGGASNSGLHIPLYIDRDSRVVEKERVAVHSMYEKPSEEHPNGRIVHTTREQLLGEEELPFGEIQIEHFRAIPLPGELWGTSLVSQGIPLQLELNRGRSQLIENRNLCSRPQIIAAFGAVERETWDNRPGSIQNWDPIAARGIEPHYLSPPQVPQWVMSILQLAEEDLADLTSRHDASQGQTSSNVTSGRQAAIYQGADSARLTPSIRRFEKSLEKVGKWLLREAKTNLSGEQVIRIVGKNRTGEYLKFAANDISDNCNVRYEIASQLPWARESQRQQIIFLNQQGKVDDQTMFELLEMPTSTRVWETDQAHKLNARLENEKLKMAYFPPITTDNHEVHLREHEEEVNRPENRERLISEMQSQAQLSGDQAQIPGSMQSILQHMEAHRKLIPAAQPAPPMTRVNLNIERLLTELAKLGVPIDQLMPYAVDLMKDASGFSPPAQPAPQEPQMGSMGAMPTEGDPPAAGEFGTPAGGMDGQLYQAPQGATQPNTDQMMGGPDFS